MKFAGRLQGVKGTRRKNPMVWRRDTKNNRYLSAIRSERWGGPKWRIFQEAGEWTVGIRNPVEDAWGRSVDYEDLHSLPTLKAAKQYAERLELTGYEARRQNSARRANAGAVEWESDLIRGPYTHDYKVWAEWDKHEGYRVVTLTRLRNAARAVPWHEEKVTIGYPDMALAIAAAKERAAYLRRKFARRPNPALAILNPLPAHLQQFARDQRLTPDELEQFTKAVARYCEFHDVEPEDVTLSEVDPTVAPEWMSEGDGVRFLVGMGETEDVSYSANAKGAYRNSKKHGIPYRHEFPSKPHMATDPDGQMIFVVNKPTGPHFGVSDWIRG